MFAISSDLHMTRCLFLHGEYVVIYITESFPYQVGICAIRIQSWAKEYCKYSDGQGIARMPQFRWAGSHFYLKHGCFAQLIKAHLFPRCPFWPRLKILCFGELSVILLQMKCWGCLWIIPVALCYLSQREVTSWCSFHFTAVSSILLGLCSTVCSWVSRESILDMGGFSLKLVEVCQGLKLKKDSQVFEVRKFSWKRMGFFPCLIGVQLAIGDFLLLVCLHWLHH